MAIAEPPPLPPTPPDCPPISGEADAAPPPLPELPRRRWDLLSDDRVPPWLISSIIHAGVVILMAVWTITRSEEAPRTIVVKISEDQPEQPIVVTKPIVPPVVDPAQAEAAVKPLHSFTAIAPAKATQQQTVVSPRQQDPRGNHAVMQALERVNPETEFYLPAGGGLQGRSGASRKALGDTYGATPESEAAVEAALEWLAAHQLREGSWDFDLSHGPCNGQCRNHRNNPDGQATPKTAATGLALLPFLGAGYDHQSGKYAKVVSRGLYYLRGQMREGAGGMHLMHGSMYGHGIATLAIAEAYAMTGDPELMDLLRELAIFIAAVQHKEGGWRYKPAQPGDMTVTGWQVMALKSCKLGGAPVPTNVFSKAKQFVDSKAAEGGRFGYLEPGEKLTPTAVGLLTSMYLGRNPIDPTIQAGCKFLAENGPSNTNAYFNYYATMTLHHARHESFAEWNEKMREYLVGTQSRAGHEQGSWHFRDRFGDVGGRLYTTCMCALVLETYYRYLPLWKAAEFPL